MKKKLFALLLSTVLLAGCTMGTPKKNKKKQSSEEEVVAQVTNVSINRSEINFNLNEEHSYTVETLIATVEGEGDYDTSIAWSSSNENVATVDNGVVHGVGLGSATITAVSDFNEDKYATCSVTVINDVPVVESVTISPEQPTIDLYTESFVQLTATVHGTNSPSQQVTWSSTGSAISVDQNGKVTASQTGSGTVKATSAKDTSKSCSVTVTVVDSTPRVNSVTIMAGSSAAGTSYTLDLYTSGQKTKQFSAKVEATNGASEEVSWSSSDPSKVSVSDDGLVTALQTTTTAATITATSKFDSTKIDTVKIAVTDSTPRVSSISVSLESSISAGRTATATATVSGTNLTTDQKKVTWSSSNSSIAEVDPSTGVVTGIAVGGPVTITATSTFDSTKTGTASISVTEAKQRDTYTVMIYMCGSDLESGSGRYATADLKEILAVTQSQPEDVNIIIETGGAKSWASTYGISANYLTRYEVRDRSLVKKQQLDKASMSVSSTLQSFVEWGISNYEADKMALVFWDHGSGLDGCCYDENFQSSSWYYDYLTPIEAQTALRNAFKSTNYTEKFEWIGYDCCLMQNVEIAALNEEFANYQVASQVSEDAGGWDYTPWVTQLFKSPEGDTGSLLTTICDAFVEYYSGSKTDQTLSWLKLDKVLTFASAFDEFVGSSGKTYSNYNSAASAARCYESTTDSYDLGGFLNYSSLSVSTTVKTAFDNIVGYKKFDTRYYASKQPTGCSIFFGSATDEDTYEAITKTNFPNWSKLLLDNWSSGGWW